MLSGTVQVAVIQNANLRYYVRCPGTRADLLRGGTLSVDACDLDPTVPLAIQLQGEIHEYYGY
jgi:hypothetical protein